MKKSISKFLIVLCLSVAVSSSFAYTASITNHNNYPATLNPYELCTINPNDIGPKETIQAEFSDSCIASSQFLFDATINDQYGGFINNKDIVYINDENKNVDIYTGYYDSGSDSGSDSEPALGSG